MEARPTVITSNVAVSPEIISASASVVGRYAIVLCLADLTHRRIWPSAALAPALRVVCAAAMGATALLAVAVASLQPLGLPALRPPPLALVRPAVRPAARWRPLECMAGSLPSSACASPLQ